MKKRKYWLWLSVLIILPVAVLVICRTSWGFAGNVGEHEKNLRLEFVHTAKSWLGANEKDGSHHAIIDLYNAHEPLAREYTVTYEDAWCATFDSVVAIQCGLTDIIPTECSCGQQIQLLQSMNAWEEADDYIPLPGDLIYYHRTCTELGDCTHWPDHVGIVVGTRGSQIKVIEGNYGNKVGYRITKVDAANIRGYGIPDFANKT